MIAGKESRVDGDRARLGGGTVRFATEGSSHGPGSARHDRMSLRSYAENSKVGQPLCLLEARSASVGTVIAQGRP